VIIEKLHMKLIASLIISLLTLLPSLTVWADAAERSLVTGDKPFVLIARLHALPNASGEVLRLSEAADAAVKASEPGMLLHTFDQDPSDPLGFVWTEVYANSAALIFHLENPPLQKYLADVSPLLDNFTVELYGEVSAEAVNMLRSTGTPTSHFQSKFGYVRELTP
jgi:quinol monooxygenase YgiN